MDKKTLIKVIVGVVILLFVLEPIAINFINSGFNPRSIERGGQGKALLELELSKYKNYILINIEDEKIGEEIRNIEGVDSVIKLSGKIGVETKKVYDVYRKIKNMYNITGLSDATLVIKKASIDGKELNFSDVISVRVEPLVKEGKTLYANADVIYDKDGRVLQMGNFNLILENKPINLTFKVKKIIGEKYEYVVDWSKRNLLSKMGYKVNNAVIINSTNPILDKKDYVYYVGNNYILINESFTNKTKVEEDYEVVEFKDSVVESNSSINISFAKEIKIKYRYLLVNEEYGLEKEIESYEKYKENDSITLEIDAVYSLNNFVYIE